MMRTIVAPCKPEFCCCRTAELLYEYGDAAASCEIGLVFVSVFKVVATFEYVKADVVSAIESVCKVEFETIPVKSVCVELDAIPEAVREFTLEFAIKF